MKLTTKIFAVVLLVAGSSGIVYAVSKHGDWAMTPAEKVDFVSDRVTSKLDLSEAQREKFVALAETVVSAMREVKPGRHQHMAEIADMLEQPVFDQARALQLIQQKTQLVNDRAPGVIASLGEFVDSLNPEQKQELQAYLQHRHQHRRFGH